MKQAISAQNTKMYIENPDAAPLATGSITTGSKSEPCYLTFTDVSHLTNGAPIYVTGTGWTSLDNQEWVLQQLDAETKTAALYGSNTSKETKEFDADLAMWTVNAFADVCVVSYAINQNPATSIDTTTLCDDEKTSLVGFRDPGTLTFDFFIDPTDPDYLALQEAYDDGEVRMFEIIYRNGAVRTIPVIVQSINETGGVDQAVKGAATLKITGAPVLTQPTPDALAGYGGTVAITPLAGNAPLDVTMTITETGGNASSVLIDWKDGTSAQTVNAPLAPIPHTYAAQGSYRPSVIATKSGVGQAPLPVNDSVVVNTEAVEEEPVGDGGSGFRGGAQ